MTCGMLLFALTTALFSLNIIVHGQLIVSFTHDSVLTPFIGLHACHLYLIVYTYTIRITCFDNCKKKQTVAHSYKKPWDVGLNLHADLQDQCLFHIYSQKSYAFTLKSESMESNSFECFGSCVRMSSDPMKMLSK